MLLLQLKESSRIVFGTLQNTSNSINNELEKSDKVLTQVRNLEGDISRIESKIAYYKSAMYVHYSFTKRSKNHV